MSDPLKDIHGKSFVEGQEAEAREASAQHSQEQAVITQRAGEIAGEAIDLADRLAADGNPHKMRLSGPHEGQRRRGRRAARREPDDPRGRGSR